MRVCRHLPYQIGSGVWNMAVDDALLQTAATEAKASLRFYGWSVPTLTLGYFQAYEPALAHPHLAGLPWLRRPSGGAALVHHHELTYALALPEGKDWQAGSAWLFCFHTLVRDVLGQMGIKADLVSPGNEVKRGEVLCFLHQTPGDLLVSGCKVAGSAQRKQHGALLQHGGILLAHSPHTPEIPGILELTGLSLDARSLANALVAELSTQTGWSLADEDWTAAEQEVIVEQVRDRYTSKSWNERR